MKKRQQRVMMILESKQIPYEAIDITDPSKETDKEFMKTNAKTRGDAKYVVAPQIFNEEEYCGVSCKLLILAIFIYESRASV